MIIIYKAFDYNSYNYFNSFNYRETKASPRGRFGGAFTFVSAVNTDI